MNFQIEISDKLKMKLKETNLKGRVVLLISGLIFSLMFIKATIASFTHDESYSYLVYIQDSFMDIISFKYWYTNNHILNSLMMKYSEKLFGSSEIALRLPNLLALIVYMRYCFLLIKEVKTFLIIPIFTLLVSNIGLIDLFGVARGYGLSFGFMMMSMYYMISYLRKPERKKLIIFYGAMILATLSSFTMLTVYVSFLLVYNLVLIIKSYVENREYQFLKSNVVHVLPFFVSAIILFEPVRRIVTYGELNFGGKVGFFQDTLTFVCTDLIQKIYLSPITFLVIKTLLISMVIVSSFLILRKLIQKDKLFFSRFDGLVISNLFLIMISMVIVLLHIILKSDYPISRFSIFLVPLYLIHLGFLFQYISSIGYQKMIYTIIYSLAFLSVLSFIINFNWYSSSEWGYDMNTKNMTKDLTQYHLKNYPNETGVDLAVNWLFEPATNFYRKTHKLDWLKKVNRDDLKLTDTYYYILKNQFDTLEPGSYIVIKEYPKTGTYLLRNLLIQ